MNLRKIVGESLIGLGVLGLLGGYSCVRYSMFKKQIGLSERAQAIIETTDYFDSRNFTFSEEYHNSPDVIATKREVARIKTAEVIGKVGGYSGIALGGLGLIGWLIYPWKREESEMQ